MAYSKDLNTDDEEKVSRINSAGIINITTENLWRDAYNSMAKGDLITWNRKLDAIWLILGGDVAFDSPETKEFDKIDLEIHQTGSLGVKKQGFAFVDGGSIEKRAVQYLLLRKKSLFLRRLQNKQGKGTSYHNEDDSDFD